ncbi:MAG: choice-of-anchor tandem repeat GloVer-containing protein [Candidatus Korobacteraceae bacterium]
MDAAGHFFGVCPYDGTHGYGWVYELTNCSETCALVDLHDFSGSDGNKPYGAPVLDAHGNLYGTTYSGGMGNCDEGCGVVWEIAGASAPH